MLPKLRSLLRTAVKVRMSSTSSQSGQTSATAAPRGPISWATLGLVATGAAASVAYYQIAKQRKKETAGQGKVDSYGTPLLGGPWSMVDGQGRPVTSGSFPDQYTLLYFGFTFCPDICPNELVKMSKVVDAMGEYCTYQQIRPPPCCLGEHNPAPYTLRTASLSSADAAGLGGKLQPIFVTLDPARDSCAQVQHYVKQFHPRMIGLTGAPGQIASMAKAFRVYFTDVDKGEDGESEDYLG